MFAHASMATIFLVIIPYLCMFWLEKIKVYEKLRCGIVYNLFFCYTLKKR